MILALALATLVLGPAQGTSEPSTAAPDSLEHGGILERLKQQDFELFPIDILEIDTAFQDSLVARLDTLGLEEFEREQGQLSRRFQTDFGPGTKLMGYNRVEGLTLALAMSVRPFGPRGFELSAEGGRALAPGKYRYLGRLELPWEGRESAASLGFHYADRVDAYGSNRPFGNTMRGLLGGADEQDYLRRRGGGVVSSWQRGRASIDLGYEAHKETSVGVSTSTALFGDLAPFNPPVQEGIDRSITLGLSWGRQSELARLQASANYRVSGDGLGGDFAYNRADLSLKARHYIQRFEFVPQIEYVRTGGAPPVQRLADVGGISTVRGFHRRTRVGRESIAGRIEILVPYDVLGRLRLPLFTRARLQFVPFADAARVFDGTSDTWIHSVGLGVQQFLGFPGRAANVRLDIAVPVGPERPNDIHFSVRFAPW